MMVDYKKRAERRREYYEKIVSNVESGLGALLEGGALVLLVRFGLGNTLTPEPSFLKRMSIF